MEDLKVVVKFNGASYFLTTHKIQAIKTIREIGREVLGFVAGLREAKDVMDALCDQRTTVLMVDLPYDKRENFPAYLAALTAAGFNVTSTFSSEEGGIKGVIIKAVQEGNFKYAKALLEATIKYGGADEA